MIRTQDLIEFINKIKFMPIRIEEGKEYKEEIVARLRELEEFKSGQANGGEVNDK